MYLQYLLAKRQTSRYIPILYNDLQICIIISIYPWCNIDSCGECRSIIIPDWQYCYDFYISFCHTIGMNDMLWYMISTLLKSIFTLRQSLIIRPGTLYGTRANVTGSRAKYQNYSVVDTSQKNYTAIEFTPPL